VLGLLHVVCFGRDPLGAASIAGMKRSRRVFLSYAQADRALADLLARDIAAAGYAVWSDRNLLPGDNWAKEIADALESSEAMVVIVSPSAAKSEWVKREVEYAIGSDRYAKRLIPVVVQPTPEMPWILERMPSVPATGNPRTVSKKVVAALEHAVAPAESG